MNVPTGTRSTGEFARMAGVIGCSPLILRRALLGVFRPEDPMAALLALEEPEQA